MENQRLSQIPVLHVRGSHLAVGFSIGRTFRSQIENNLSKSEYFLHSLLPEYETGPGKALYDKNLTLCESKFPGYVAEIQGMANGSGVPFHKLFLLNLEVFITSPTEAYDKKDKEGGGCTSILSNGAELLLGHTEDAGPELLNNVFIVSAEILDADGVLVEKFTSLTYAGCLPCYTMGYNQHGFIHSINTLYPLNTLNQRSPRAFIARSLMRAKDLEEVVTILKDKGTGIADGFSINACFAKGGVPEVYNIEICPNKDGDESLVNVHQVGAGETYAHCNRYLRIQPPELKKAHLSSAHRHRTVDKYPKPERRTIIEDILSDQSDPEYSIFRTKDIIPVVTVAVGIFDISNRQWSIYTEPPNKSGPVVVLPIIF